MEKPSISGFGFEILMFLSEFVAILFFGLFVEFPEGVKTDSSLLYETSSMATIQTYYPLFMDIHIFIFVGFGFIHSFLRNASWTGAGFTFMIGCWGIQLCILLTGFWRNVCR